MTKGKTSGIFFSNYDKDKELLEAINYLLSRLRGYSVRGITRMAIIKMAKQMKELDEKEG